MHNEDKPLKLSAEELKEEKANDLHEDKKNQLDELCK